MALFNLCPSAFGLNITDTKIRAVQLKKNKAGFSLVGFLDVDLGEDIVKDGEIKDKEKLAEKIRSALSKKLNSGINSANAVFSLPEFKTFIQMIDIPQNLSGEELEEAIKWEAESNIPIPIDEAYMDWKIFSNSAEKNMQKVFLAAAPKRVVDDYANVLELAGLRAAAAEIEPIALARVVLKEDLNKDNAALIIDLSDSKTIFIIAHKNAIRFTSSMPQNDQKTVEKEAKRAFDFAREHIIKSEDVNLILSGGSADLESLSKSLAENLNVKVYISDPWAKILKSKKQEKNMVVKSAFTALGLAVRAVNLDI